MSLEDQLGEEWYEELENEFYNHYMKILYATVRKERAFNRVRPDTKDTFKAYRLTPLSEVKVVILGQDPYPHKHANGLAFSSIDSLADVPKSLQNIFKELEDDIGFSAYHNTDLTRWAKQGVLLLNRVLTVRDGLPGSHRDIGWEEFTKKTIEIVCRKQAPVIFILWGRDAQSIGHMIPPPHKVIHSPHPSPMSAYRGFFGSKPFSRANKYLVDTKQEPIDWLKDERSIEGS